MQGWTDELATGDEGIDGEHRLIFEHIARILTAPAGMGGRRATRAALDDFQQHVLEHFERERTLMRSTEYPRLEPHLRAHEVLTTYVRDLKKSIASPEMSDDYLGTAVRLIANALAAHTQTHDLALAKYLAARH